MYSLFMFFLVALAVVSAAVSSRVQMEKAVSFDNFSPKNWIAERQSVTNADIVNCIFVLKRDSSVVKKFEAELLSLATPSSASYGKWLNAEQVISKMAPATSSLDTVTKFLIGQGD